VGFGKSLPEIRAVPEDVRLVLAEGVGHDRVVSGRRAAEPAHRDHAAREETGSGGHVASDEVARDLHSLRTEERDADPGDRGGLIRRRA
jgi:hypothetical protein